MNLYMACGGKGSKGKGGKGGRKGKWLFMGEILIFDKKQADILLSLGFKYRKRKINNKETFVFIQTNELIKELTSKFEKGSFFVSKNMCF